MINDVLDYHIKIINDGDVLTESFCQEWDIYSYCDRYNEKLGSIINVGVTPLRCHFQHYFFAKKISI